VYVQAVHCTLCGGLGIIKAELTPEDKARGVIHKHVSCPACWRDVPQVVATEEKVSPYPPQEFEDEQP
jgi:hypothetical protein